MASSKLAKPKLDTTEERLETAEEEEFRTGPYSALYESVKDQTPILISIPNDRKLLCHVRAFDRHCNMILENVAEMWTDIPRVEKGKINTKLVNKDRFIGRMFLHGDCVIGEDEETSREENPQT